MALMDRREVKYLRHAVLQLREDSRRQEKTISEQVSQIANANLRVARCTETNLELKKKLREHGISADGMAA